MSTVPSDPGVRSLMRTLIRLVVIFGGPATPVSSAGDEVLALAVAEAAEGVA